MKKAVVAPFTKGVNFSCWLEYFNTVDDIYEDFFTKKDFENAKSLGCDVVRLPIHFERMTIPQTNFEIEPKILKILDKVAAWAEELKIHVIFDFHNNTHIDSKTSQNVEEVLTPIWKQIATRYKDSSEYLVFELMNEPHGIEVSLWNEIIARVFALVRSIDKKHFIIVGGADWNSFAAMKTLPDFHDDKVIYTFHFYDPHTFTHQGAPWCHMERVKDLPFPYDEKRMPPLPENPTEDEIRRWKNYPEDGKLEKVEQFFDQYVEFSCERNAPVYCGEFGCLNRVISEEERVKWYKLVVQRLEERGIARTSWDYYGGFGIFKKSEHQNQRENWRFPVFPDDLDLEICRALGLNVNQL